MIIILGSIVNIIGVTYLYDHLMNMRILTSIMKQNIHTSSRDHEESACLQAQSGLLTTLY